MADRREANKYATLLGMAYVDRLFMRLTARSALATKNSAWHPKSGAIVAAIRQAAPRELTDVRLFDIFCPKESGDGRRSLAYTLEFRSAERTLTDDEVNAACQTILASVKTSLGVEVRAG